MVAEDLDLDMAGARDHPFENARAMAEGGIGLAAALQHLGGQLVRTHHRGHAAAAARPRPPSATARAFWSG